MKPYQIAVVIGRFQIPHSGHQKIIQEAARIADKVVILVGSVGQPETPKNPFSYEQRKQMLQMVISNYIDYTILPVSDSRYNLNQWLADVANKVNSTITTWTDKPPKIVLVGHEKDSTSFYLDLFPQWVRHEVESVSSLSSTTIRDALFEGSDAYSLDSLDPKIMNYLNGWATTDNYRKLVKEYEFIKNYKEAWKDAPYDPTFVTVDAVVVQSGHILLVKRRASPGKGLYALPGGFVGQNETLKTAVLRELVEETKIKLQPQILSRAITKQKVYDDVGRSLRGRTITHAFLLELSGHDLPRVKGADDAEKAEWFPLNEVYSMGKELYEDHLDIITNILGDR